jgi:ADP-heptose:LPS heptosyltransferase
MRLLFITATRVGDAVLTTGLLNRLITDHPGIRVTVACGPVAHSLFAAVPGLERIVVMTKRRYVRHWLALWREVVATKWDIIVDLRGSGTSLALRAGRRHIWRGAGLAEARVAQLARFMGYDPPPSPHLWITEASRLAAEALIPRGSPVLALAPIANWPGKQWRAERFAQVVERLTGPADLLPGARIAIFGAPHEHDQADDLRRHLAEFAPGRVIDAMNSADLLTVAAALCRCQFFIGNDSGLMHIAAAMGIPTIGLFGPSNERAYGPWGPSAQAVRADEAYEVLLARGLADRSACAALLDTLPVERVVDAAHALWRRVGNPIFTING